MSYNQETEAFLQSAMPGLRLAEIALHNGDAKPRSGVWSQQDPVTLFGAIATKSGWEEIGPFFEQLAKSFKEGSAWEYEILAAGASGDLAYVVGIEHTTAGIGGKEAKPYKLRVTTIFRREEGKWKVVHRHGDAYDASTGAK